MKRKFKLIDWEFWGGMAFCFLVPIAVGVAAAQAVRSAVPVASHSPQDIPGILTPDLGPPTVPQAIVVTNPPVLLTIYAVVVGQNYRFGPISAKSNEVVISNTTPSRVALAWVGTDPFYTILFGTNSGLYTSSVWTGTNTSSRLLVVPTNVLISLTGVWPGWSATNPTDNRFFRLVKTNANVWGVETSADLKTWKWGWGVTNGPGTRLGMTRTLF